MTSTTHAILAFVATRPASIAISVALTGVHAAVKLNASTGATVGLSAASVLDQHRAHTAVTAQCVHLTLSHLALNTITLLQLARVAEARRGWGHYLADSAMVAVVCGALTTAALEARRRLRLDARPVAVVGYSGVLFGWMACAVADRGAAHRVVTPAGPMSAWLHVAIFLVITKAVMPHTSMTAHVAGAVAGVALSVGALPWVALPLVAVACCWQVSYLVAARRKAAAVGDSAPDVEVALPSTPLVAAAEVDSPAAPLVEIKQEAKVDG